LTPDPRHQTPDAPPPGRCLAIGDIHGCFDALTTLAEYVPLEADDCLVTLGDYTSRGPDSCKVLDWLIARHKQGHVIALRGNHEIMMLQARDREDFRRDWLSYGGDATLASYSPVAGEGRLAVVPAAHWQFLEEELRGWYETPTHFFVHANYHPDCPLSEQPEDMLYWEKFDDPRPHESGKIMVCGHTPQKSGIPRNIGHAVCIDTWAYGQGWLTCLDVGSGKYWQANQRRETRSGWLAKAIS
jgi:serine/threonine protein phosphatase 1